MFIKFGHVTRKPDFIAREISIRLVKVLYLNLLYAQF